MDINLKIRSFLAKALGLFWILDGLLQLQPKMFGQQFITEVLAPNLIGQPTLIQSIINFGIRVYGINIPFADIIVIAIQIGVGILLLLPQSTKSFKVALYLSIIWGLVVWVFGEGLGNLLTGSASFYTGAPGSVLIYVLIPAILLWRKNLTIEICSKIAGIIFIVLAFLQLQPVFWTASGITSLLESAFGDKFNFISYFPTAVSNLFLPHPVIYNLILFTMPVILGLLLILKPGRAVAIAALIFLFFVWWLGQDFGQLSTLITGLTTDLNTAPLLALLILPLLLILDNN